MPVFVCYLNIVLSVFAFDCNYLRRVATSEFLVFVGSSFVAVPTDSPLLSKTADPRLLSNPYGELTPFENCIAGILEQFDFYEIVHCTALDPVFAYLAFRWQLGVNLKGTCLVIEYPLLPFDQTTGEAFRLPGQRLHGRNRNTSHHIVYNYR